MASRRLARAALIAVFGTIILASVWGAKSPARLEHLAFAVVWLVAFEAWRAQASTLSTLLYFSVAGLACAVGAELPDWDISLLGIGGHRNPLFHSALPILPLAWLARVTRLWAFPRTCAAALSGFAVGLASHLALDTLFYGDVRWLSGGSADRLWLVVSCVAAMVYAVLVVRRGARASATTPTTEGEVGPWRT